VSLIFPQTIGAFAVKNHSVPVDQKRVFRVNVFRDLVEHIAAQMYQRAAGVALQMKMPGAVFAAGDVLIASAGNASDKIFPHFAAPSQLVQMSVDGSETDGRPRFAEILGNLGGGDVRFSERRHVFQYRLALSCVIPSRTAHDIPPGSNLKSVFKLSYSQISVNMEETRIDSPKRHFAVQDHGRRKDFNLYPSNL
jgi:hypothetical protein